jgi:hypothetical protein
MGLPKRGGAVILAKPSLNLPYRFPQIVVRVRESAEKDHAEDAEEEMSRGEASVRPPRLSLLLRVSA